MKISKSLAWREVNNSVTESDASDLFWNIFDNDEFGIALTDESGNLLLSNDSFETQVVKITSPPDLLSIIHTYLNSPATQSNRVSVDAGDTTIKLSLTPLHGHSSGASFLWVVGDDEKNLARQKMATVKNLYRSFIDASFELIFRTTVDGKILFTNRVFLTSFGLDSSRKIIGATVQSIFKDTQQYLSLQTQLSETKRVSGEVVAFKKSNGKSLTGKVNCYLHHDQFGVPVINWTVLDISRQVESENALQVKNDQLAKVNHQMEKFLYSTSHDLRSPITSIQGLVHLLQMESNEPLVLDYISKIEASALKLDKIIRDIMTLSRVTYQHINSELVDFELLTWKAIDGYRLNPVTNQITFDVKVIGSVPFYTDRHRVEVILDNIIRNSINFYDSSKAKSFIQVNVSFDNKNVNLEFFDNGIGIGKQHLDQIFNMFYKASHHSKGAGLGLYIVKETVEKLSGTIRVESEIGFGTVMRLTIPNDPKGLLIARKISLQKHA